MFVTSNKVFDLKQYFRGKLSGRFSHQEIKLMFQLALQKRLGLSDSEILFSDEVRLSESDLLYMRSIVNRLLENEPFQYLIGETYFCELLLNCDSRALIPRPETEELVYWIKESWKRDSKLKILDLCTGSACIALALKHFFPQAEVSALDFSVEALELASENRKKTKLDIELFQADALSDELDLSAGTALFDCWVSNPPYIPHRDKDQMSENVLDHEPHLALFVADEDPFVFYRKIAEKAKTNLKSGGLLFFEIHEDHAPQIEKIILNLAFKSCEIKLDLQGKKRMIKAEKC